MERFDVAVIGAGPAGSSAAGLLARKGYSVALVDKRLFPSEKLCGDFLNPINWPLFERLGVAQELLSLEHERIEAFHISSFTGEEALFPFPSHEGNFPFGLGLRRFYLDHALLKHAEKEGATVRQGYRITGLKRHGDGWSITVSDRFGEEAFCAAFLIGADGRNSWVAHRLGVARPAGDRAEFVAFQLHLQLAKGLGRDVQIHLFPGGYAGLVSLGEGMLNLCLSIEKKRASEFSSVQSLFQGHLYKNRYLRTILQDAEVVGDMRSTYPVYFSPRRSYGERFLLIGDAARVTEPVTGEGVYFALRSAELAAEAVEKAFIAADFSSRKLSLYDELCGRSFSSRQRVNRLTRSLICRPRLLAGLIALSTKTSFPIASLVRYVCSAHVPSSP